MFKEKKHVGRPSNEELKRRRNKKILMFGVPIAFVFVAICLIINGNKSNLMGNSVVEYYCEDTSYNLEGNKCVKEVKERSVMLGDINIDDKITDEDLDLLTRYIDYIEYEQSDEEVSNLTPIQIKAADISEDNEVYNVDVDILKAYLEHNTDTLGTYQENIGVKRVCNDGFTLDGNDCVKKEIVDAKVKTNNSNAINSKKDDEPIGTHENYGIQKQTNQVSNPVVVTLKPENNANKLKVNTTYKINVNFDIKDNSKQYYYIWTNYLYGEKNYSTECKPVIQGEHSGNFKVIGPRKVNVTVYSDSACQNQVSSTDSAEYACDGCQNMVDVTFKPQDDKTSVPNNTKYKLNVNFDVKDTTKDYYYIWSAYLNGEKNSETKCTKITPGEHGGSLVINGKRIVSLTVYGDSQCKNKIKSFNSKQYVCIDCDKSVDVTLRPQDNKTSFTYGTNYKMDVIFNINDTSKNYYYIWYNFKNGVNNYKTKCTQVTQGAHEGSFTIDGTKKVQVLIYSDSSCKNKIKTVSSKTYTSTKTFAVKFNANGGSGSMGNQNITYGVSTKLNANKFTRSGYYFIGWRAYNNSTSKWMCYTNKNKTSLGYTDKKTCEENGYVVYRNTQSISNTASVGQTVTMYALWQYSYNGNSTKFTGFEKDVKGATVWPMVRQNLYQNSNGTKAIAIVPQGVALKAIDMTNKTNESKSYVKVKYNGKTGYIDGWITMINLPDVISRGAIYNITNASASIFKSRGNSLWGVTGYDIYGSKWSSNIAPVRIETAKKIQKAASLAEKHGNRIKIYDSFRPWSVQRKIADAVKADWFTGKTYSITSDFNKDKSRNTNGASVTSIADAKGWFIAIASTRPASHNLAKAIDVTLVTIDDNQDVPTQSKMHELSANSIPTKTGVDNNKAELALHNLFMDAGFYFLPSEWWHFEDQNNANYGKYYNEIKCLGSPSALYGCSTNQIKKA